MTSIFQSPLYPIANPKSIAFFGASNNYSAMGSCILSTILSDGYEGTVYPVHPTENRVLNLPAYAGVKEIPAIADMAFIVLPTKIVAQTLKACGERGIRHAVIVSAGFNEVGGQGVERQQELQQIADQYHIRFIGPNCIGVANSHIKLNATFLPSEGKQGFIGMASQSGSFITQMFSYLSHRFGQGFSTGFSLGNEANIDMADCIQYLGACPNTKVIALYIESIRQGQKFIEIARNVSQAATGLNDVAENVSQSSTAVSHISREIGEISQSSDRISRSSTRVSASADELSKLSGFLDAMVGKFVI